MKKLFEKFDIIEVLKKDEHSTVYLANHIFLGKKIILKTLDTDKLTDPAILNRFKREAKILAKLEHPNIIKVLDFGTYKNNFYISFEYFLSANLREFLKTANLSDAQKESLFIQLLKALNAAHSANIIHRDLKPENILINDSLQLKMADFGLAIEQDENLLTSKSSIVGTPAYMSPEQIKGEKLTPQSDLFSLGIVLYELYCGENPFLGRDINETINNILSFKSSEIITKFSGKNEYIKQCIAQMLQKDSKKRPRSINEMLAEINVVEENKIKSTKTITGKPKKYRYLLAVTFISILIAVIIIIYSQKTSVEPKQVNNKNIVAHQKDTIAKKEKRNIISEEFPIKKNTIKKEETFEKKAETGLKEIKPVEPAKLLVQCLPWAKVIIDSMEIENLSEFIKLDSGLHQLELKNPGYPTWVEEINLKPGEIKYYKVSLDTLFGFLDCKVFPWGEVFVDGNYIGQTPFFKPFLLNPGKHTISVHNSDFESLNREIVITKMETLKFEINLNQVN